MKKYRNDVMPNMMEDNINNQQSEDMNIQNYKNTVYNAYVVQIKSVYNNNFVEIGFDDFFYATGNQSTGKIFMLILLEDNNIMLRIHGGRFLRIDKNGFLVVDTNNEGASVFTLEEVDGVEYALLAPNGSYLRVRESDNRLVADVQEIDEYAAFKFRTITYY